MKTLLLLFLLALPVVAQTSDYTWKTNNGAITITKYTGAGGDVTIPAAINGMPVTTIAPQAFMKYAELTSVIVPESITHLDGMGFLYCSKLKSIKVEARNPAYCSVDGVVFDKEKTQLIIFPGGKNGDYCIPKGVAKIGGFAFGGCPGVSHVTIPDGVTSLETHAFMACTSLTNIVIPTSVTDIGPWLFDGCARLKTICFKGDAPTLAGASLGASKTTVVNYMPTAAGWGVTFGSLQTAVCKQ